MAVFGFTLEGKPWYWGLIIGVALGGLLFWVGNNMLLAPKRQQIERQENRLSTLQVKIQEGRAAKQRLPQFREENARLEVELSKLIRILPTRRNTAELLRSVRALAEQGDFDLQLFKTNNEIERDFYYEWPINVNLNGTYHKLAQFFDRLSRFQRILNVDNLRITALPGNNDARTIAATFKVKTFIAKDDAMPPDTVEGADAGGNAP